MNSVIDQLSWEQFKIHSEKAKKPLIKISEFNRLIAHSKNFFLISGYGAFTDGYILVISKDFIPSYGLTKKEEIEEVKFLIKLIKNFIKNKYDRKTVIFEHGMCACIGGLDRAHLHLMSVSKNCNQKHIKDSINQVLYNRKAGVKYIEYNNYKLENLHDINQIYENHKNTDKIKIVGDIMKIEDIQNLPVEDWPMITLNHITKGGHYVFFDSGDSRSSFLTTHNFQTQFGREVVFEIEKLLDKKFYSEVKKLEKSNPYIEVWRWQNYMFEKKIIKTIEDSRKMFKVLKKKFSEEFKKYQLKII
tara:strand:+ start:1287 stop:2195 length:909 start_codon:yes stop_codon:yes gene_type:complete